MSLKLCKETITRKVIAKLAKKVKVNNLELFHGSNNKFEVFDKKQQKSGFYQGVYLSSKKEDAQKFGKYLYTVNLTGDFFEFDSREQENKMLRETGTTGSGYFLSEKLKEEGYIGIKRGSEYIVFEPEFIKIKEKSF